MKILKKTSVGGEWVKKGVDIKDGDETVILNEGSIVPGDYGDRHVFKIKTKNGEKNVSFNQTSLNACFESFGEESEHWVGKQVKVTIVKQNVAGKFVDVAYLAPPDWVLGEDGFVPPGGNSGSIETPF